MNRFEEDKLLEDKAEKERREKEKENEAAEDHEDMSPVQRGYYSDSYVKYKQTKAVEK